MASSSGSGSDSVGEVMPALAAAWDEIRGRHRELPPVVLAIGSGSRRGARRRCLAHFGAMRWSPFHEDEPDDLRAARDVFDDAIEKGDVSAALAASCEQLWICATQLSQDSWGVLSEVFITDDGLALSPADLLATLLHEAAHAIATQRGIRDASRQGRYHNARFKAVAEEVGLDVLRDPPFGWSGTTLPATTAATYTATLAAFEQALNAHRERLPSLVGSEREPTRRGTTILACGCGQRIRGGSTGFAAREVICVSCGSCPPDGGLKLAEIRHESVVGARVAACK